MMHMYLLSFYILSHIFVLINLLSLVVLLCQLYNSTAIVAILIKLLLLLYYYYVALMKHETIVGHVPAEHSKIFKFFIRRGGSISAVVTGKREKGLGLVIYAVYLFTGDDAFVLFF